METTMTDPAEIIARAEPRSNVFLAALIDMPGGPVPVRVRNLSPRGALVEGPVLPTSGAVQLRRGNLEVRGKVAWLHESYCGLQFSSSIDVPAWLKRIGHQGQDRIDMIMASLRNGTVPKVAEAPPLQQPGQIAEALLEVAERLAGLEGLSVEAGEQILKIDILARAIQAWSARDGAA
jgi:hypothetical protein